MWGPYRENLHYLWKRVVNGVGKPSDNYRSYNYYGVYLTILQHFSIDSAGFPCRDLAIPSPRSFHGVKNLQCVGGVGSLLAPPAGPFVHIFFVLVCLHWNGIIMGFSFPLLLILLYHISHMGCIMI